MKVLDTILSYITRLKSPAPEIPVKNGEKRKATHEEVRDQIDILNTRIADLSVAELFARMREEK